MNLRIPLATSNLVSQITTACLLEASARKPGNVHPAACFDDCDFEDFLESARVCGPALAAAGTDGVGQAICSAVRETRAATGQNTNLGMLLLLGPLAAVPSEKSLADGVRDILDRLDTDDTRKIYEAIRAAKPGGLGQAEAHDVRRAPQVGIVEAMRLAADRDLIALQYANGFADVLGSARHRFLAWWGRTANWEQSVVGLHLDLLATFPESLIARKCGMETAHVASEKARDVLAAGWPDTAAGCELCAAFDGWLRADGHQRNPGTTADLIAATLFALIRDGNWQPPSQLELSITARKTSRINPSQDVP